MGGQLAQPIPAQAPPVAPGGVPGLGIMPTSGTPGLGVEQPAALQGGAAPRKPEDELAEKARAQRVTGVFGGGGNDILSQLLAAIMPAAPGATNVPGSIIGPGAGGIEAAAPAVPGAAPMAAPPGAINIDPVIAAIIQAYQQMTQAPSFGRPGQREGESMYERPAPRGTPESISPESEATNITGPSLPGT